MYGGEGRGVGLRGERCGERNKSAIRGMRGYQRVLQLCAVSVRHVHVMSYPLDVEG